MELMCPDSNIVSSCKYDSSCVWLLPFLMVTAKCYGKNLVLYSLMQNYILFQLHFSFGSIITCWIGLSFLFSF
jgi:hypothetical protein